MDRHDIHLAITDALRSYCRGVDRLEPALIAAAFHPGAQLIDYGPEPTTIEAFVDRVVVSLGQRFIATQHRISNISIDVDVDVDADSPTTATVEAYVLAFHVQDGEQQKLMTFNGRYIDRFEEREGVWRIAQRTLRVDWSKVETIDASMGGSWVRSGRGGTPDPIFG